MIAVIGIVAMMALPYPKNGQCASGYFESGGYCTPMRNAKPAVPKTGSCPSGWTQSGSACVKMDDHRR